MFLVFFRKLFYGFDTKIPVRGSTRVNFFVFYRRHRHFLSMVSFKLLHNWLMLHWPEVTSSAAASFSIMDIIRVLPWLGYCPALESVLSRYKTPFRMIGAVEWCSLLGENSSYFLCYGHRKEFTGSCWESPVVHSGKRSRRTVCVRQNVCGRRLLV